MNTSTRARPDRDPGAPERYPQATDRGVTRTQPQDAPFLVDWLDYTVPDGVPLSVALPGAGELDWQPLDHGRNGYRQALAYGHIQVHYDGQPGMGAMVHLSGQGCRELEASGLLGDDPAAGWIELHRHILDNGFSVARVDYALDDRDGELDMDTIAAAAGAGDFTSKWHGGHVEQQFDGEGWRENRTIRFGAPTSNSRLRIYDKRAEQLEKGEDVDGPWIRVELQLRDEQAEALMRQLLHGAGDVEPLLGVLRAHLEFKERSATDTNKRRWAPASWWAAFLQHASKRRLGVGRRLRTLETVLSWTQRQVAPSLALIVRAHRGEWRFLRRLVEDGDARLRPRDLALLSAAVA